MSSSLCWLCALLAVSLAYESLVVPDRVFSLRVRSDGAHAVHISWSPPYLRTNRPTVIQAYVIGWGTGRVDEYITEVEGWRHGCRVIGLRADTKYVFSIRVMSLGGVLGPRVFHTVYTHPSLYVLMHSRFTNKI